MSSAQETLDRYLTVRTQYPIFFKKPDIMEESLRDLLAKGYQGQLIGLQLDVVQGTRLEITKIQRDENRVLRLSIHVLCDRPYKMV